MIGNVRQRDDRKQDRHDARDRTIRGALASFSDVRYWDQSGKHLLGASISPFAPKQRAGINEDLAQKACGEIAEVYLCVVPANTGTYNHRR